MIFFIEMNLFITSMYLGRILYDKSLLNDARIKLLNILSVAALKDDVILLLHQDRKEHIIMNYAFDIDRHPQEEQLPLAQFVSKSDLFAH